MKSRLLSAAALLPLFVVVNASSNTKTPQAPAIDFTKYAPYTATSNEGDFIIAPEYKDAPELKVRNDVPKGKVYHFVMKSEDSKIYPGIAKGVLGKIVPYTRRVSVYVPSQYVPGTKAPFFVAQDSLAQGECPTILDNMIADHRLPAMIAIFIDSGGSDAQGSERGLEYDTMSGWYAQFIESEVLPRAASECNVEFTKDPNGRMTMGGSSGAACALTMAWYRPDLFRRVLSYSGTFVNQAWPPNPETLHGAWEYHDGLIQNSKNKPLRIWMEVGEHDLRYNDDVSTYHNWVLANNRTAAVLKAKHYHYQYVFARDANHVDGRVVRQTLPQALEWVWRGYPIKH